MSRSSMYRNHNLIVILILALRSQNEQQEIPTLNVTDIDYAEDIDVITDSLMSQG